MPSNTSEDVGAGRARAALIARVLRFCERWRCPSCGFDVIESVSGAMAECQVCRSIVTDVKALSELRDLLAGVGETVPQREQKYQCHRCGKDFEGEPFIGTSGPTIDRLTTHWFYCSGECRAEAGLASLGEAGAAAQTAQLLKAIVIAWDAEQFPEFYDALAQARELLGFKLDDEVLAQQRAQLEARLKVAPVLPAPEPP